MEPVFFVLVANFQDVFFIRPGRPFICAGPCPGAEEEKGFPGFGSSAENWVSERRLGFIKSYIKRRRAFLKFRAQVFLFAWERRKFGGSSGESIFRRRRIIPTFLHADGGVEDVNRTFLQLQISQPPTLEPGCLLSQPNMYNDLPNWFRRQLRFKCYRIHRRLLQGWLLTYNLAL